MMVPVGTVAKDILRGQQLIWRPQALQDSPAAAVCSGACSAGVAVLAVMFYGRGCVGSDGSGGGNRSLEAHSRGQAVC